jgi:hypothetical protein
MFKYHHHHHHHHTQTRIPFSEYSIVYEFIQQNSTEADTVSMAGEACHMTAQ